MVTRVAFAAFSLIALTVGCTAIVGVRERCAAGCFDDRSRVVCSSEGVALPDPCPAETPFCGDDRCLGCRSDADCARPHEGACEADICRDERCIVVPRSGECEKGGTCRGYACIGPSTVLAAGQSSTCMAASDGLVWCWGDNANGQLGSLGIKQQSTPYLVGRIGDELGRATSVTVGYGHSCALLADGRTVCWGNNLAGQSTGRAPDPTAEIVGPTIVDTAPRAASVVAGYGHTCLLTAESRVFCWGRNIDGEVGSNSGDAIVPGPTEIAGGRALRSLSTAESTTCATDGTRAFCWGQNKYGQMGPSFGQLVAREPVEIQGLASGGVLQIAASWSHVCAVVGTTGSVQCWGNARWGQLGDGVVQPSWGPGSPGDGPNPTPRFVVRPDSDQPLTTVTLLWTGSGSHLCARASSFTPDVLCWGESTTTEIGVRDKGPFPRAIRSTFARNAISVIPGDDHTCVLRQENDGLDVSCWGQGRAGQVGDAEPLHPHVQEEPARVQFPRMEGGLAAVRANQ